MTPRARYLWLPVVAFLLVLRIPSLAQPAGADQGLYAYVGTRILKGELPYRDAWDQKPPAIHFTYAVMYGLWPHDSVVAAADLVAAIAIALMLVPLGRALTGYSAAGMTAAVLFLLLGDPTLTRLAGVRVRSQCETFIAAAVTAAFLLALTGRGERAARRAFVAGALAGLAVTFKYNALVYAPVVFAAVAWDARDWGSIRRLLMAFAAGVLCPVAAMIALFAAGSAAADLYAATISYNLEYSGETYSGPWSFARYLVTFPIQQARVDALWTLGGLGCLILIVRSSARLRRDAHLLLPVLWVSAACLTIAINGSRGLPQYFVQAAPALALAAGVGAAVLWPARRLAPPARLAARVAGVALVSIAAWRVTDFTKIPRNAAHDLAYLRGQISRDEHLARYAGRAEDKYSAVSVARLGAYLKERTTEGERIYVFGFSPGVYVQSGRPSASRFFWSRPVIVNFNATDPRYGAAGLLEDLQARPPAYVLLQIHDWAPPPGDSESFFLGNAGLADWLKAGYQRVSGVGDEDYSVWRREK